MSGKKDYFDDPGPLLAAMDFARSAEERQREHQEQMRQVLLPFLEVADGIERTLDEIGQDGVVPVSTLRLMHRMILGALKRGGVEQMSCIGDELNPSVHEVVAIQRRTDVAEDTVVLERRKGYLLDDVLVRRPQVEVATGGDTGSTGKLYSKRSG